MVNVPAAGVALPISVALMLANCACPPMTLPVAVSVIAFTVATPIVLANTLPLTFTLVPVNVVPVLPINPELS